MSNLKGCRFPKTSLQGIVEIQPNENGEVGLKIQDLLSINNQLEQHEGTEGNLILLNERVSILRKKPNQNLQGFVGGLKNWIKKVVSAIQKVITYVVEYFSGGGGSSSTTTIPDNPPDLSVYIVTDQEGYSKKKWSKDFFPTLIKQRLEEILSYYSGIQNTQYTLIRSESYEVLDFYDESRDGEIGFDVVILNKPDNYQLNVYYLEKGEEDTYVTMFHGYRILFKLLKIEDKYYAELNSAIPETNDQFDLNFGELVIQYPSISDQSIPIVKIGDYAFQNCSRIIMNYDRIPPFYDLPYCGYIGKNSFSGCGCVFISLIFFSYYNKAVFIERDAFMDTIGVLYLHENCKEYLLNKNRIYWKEEDSFEYAHYCIDNDGMGVVFIQETPTLDNFYRQVSYKGFLKS